jgi:hypothetical protein
MVQENKSTKKIILLGGSNVGFGVSAEEIEKRLGIKTINLGLNMHLGLTDFQAFLCKNLTKDDIVVFAPEWEFYSKPDYCDPRTLNDLIVNNYRYGELIGNNKYVIKSFFSNINLAIFQTDVSQTRNNKTPYIYHCFNKNGDIISHCNLPAPGPKKTTVDTLPLKLDLFPKYFPFLLTNKTVFLFPPVQDRVYNKYKAYLNHIHQALTDRHYIVVDSVANNVYPVSDFFDTEYHVKCDVRPGRTEKLISFLQQFINK